MTLRILQIPAGEIRIPAAVAGSELTIFLLARHLVRAGHEVAIADRRFGPSDMPCEDIDGVRIVRRVTPLIPPIRCFTCYPGIDAARHAANRLLFGLFVALPASDGYDVIQIHDLFVLLGLLIHPLGRRAVETRRTFYSHHSSSWPSPTGGIGARLVMRLLRWAARRICGITVESNGAADLFFSSGISREKIRLLPPGRDLSEFVASDTVSGADTISSEQRPVIMYAGRVTAEKGVDVLIDAFRILVKDVGTCAELVIAGPYETFDIDVRSSPYVSGLLKQIEKGDLAELVMITGPVPRKELINLFHRCAVFVLPSKRETFGSVITEAMAAGKPVVATRTDGALMQIKDGWNGFLVDVGDAFSLAGKLKYLLEHPSVAREMGQNALESSRGFDWISLIDRYLDALVAPSV